jgi:hypothetical protein
MQRSGGGELSRETIVNSRRPLIPGVLSLNWPCCQIEMVEPEEHTSPDGLLTLAVDALKDGDVAIGFHGYPWHTHADILASTDSMDETDAVRQFIDNVLNDRSLIAVQLIDGHIHDVWITDDPANDRKYRQSNEEIQFRYWSGRRYSHKADSPSP